MKYEVAIVTLLAVVALPIAFALGRSQAAAPSAVSAPKAQVQPVAPLHTRVTLYYASLSQNGQRVWYPDVALTGSGGVTMMFQGQPNTKVYGNVVVERE